MKSLIKFQCSIVIAGETGIQVSELDARFRGRDAVKPVNLARQCREPQ
jgi:hypothetical protein